MPEIEKPLPADGGENGEGADAKNNGADKSEGGDKPEGGEGGEGKGGKKPAEADKGSQGKDEPEVRQRKTVKDFIIERKERKIAKLEGKTKGEEGSGEGDEGDGNDDDEISPEDRKVIAQVVTPMLKPLLEKSLQAEDEAEVQDFLKANPDFKPYEAKARVWMNHPSRRNLPIKSIFYEVAGDDLLKIGAKRGKEADDEAKRAGAGGGNAKGVEGGANAWDLPKDEFAKKQEELRRSR